METILIPQPVAYVDDQRIIRRLPANCEITPIEIREPGALHAFSRATLIVIDERKIRVRGHVIVEDLDGFSTSLHALIELGVGLGERSRVKICAPELESAYPGVEGLFAAVICRIASLVSFFFNAIRPAMILP